jgi:hypothetical protein
MKNEINHVCPTCGHKKPVYLKSLWKTEKFKMYKKIKNKLEFKNASIITAVRTLCNSNTYKNRYLNFYNESEFNVDKEIKNLYHLLTDPRQREAFNEVE